MIAAQCARHGAQTAQHCVLCECPRRAHSASGGRLVFPLMHRRWRYRQHATPPGAEFGLRRDSGLRVALRRAIRARTIILNTARSGPPVSCYVKYMDRNPYSNESIFTVELSPPFLAWELAHIYHRNASATPQRVQRGNCPYEQSGRSRVLDRRPTPSSLVTHCSV